MKSACVFAAILIPVSSVFGQINLKDSVVSASIVNIDFGIGIPAGDLASTFGAHLTAGIGYQYKTKKNLIFGVDGAYIYGNTVKDDSVLSLIENNAGYVIGTDGLQYSPALWEQGFDFAFQLGKVTSLFAINPNSGLTLLGGAGLLQHNIWIYIDPNTVPQLTKEYKKGYDQLSNGLMLDQYIGYYFFSNKYFADFRSGFEIDEGFTKDRRTVDYNTNSADDATHFDMMITFKVSWNLTLFEKPFRKFYYY